MNFSKANEYYIELDYSVCIGEATRGEKRVHRD